MCCRDKYCIICCLLLLSNRLSEANRHNLPSVEIRELLLLINNIRRSGAFVGRFANVQGRFECVSNQEEDAEEFLRYLFAEFSCFDLILDKTINSIEFEAQSSKIERSFELMFGPAIYSRRKFMFNTV